MRVVQQGDRVRVHYVKLFQDGDMVSSYGKLPTEVTAGIDHPPLPGLGLALVGLTVGESRILIVPAGRAYGPHDPGRVHVLARARFSRDTDLFVGKWVRLWDHRRRRRLIRIVEIRGNTVVVDANHRWAGQSLELEVEVMSIRGPELGSVGSKDVEGDSPEPEPDLAKARFQ